MEKFESQFSDLDVQTSYMEETMSNTTAVSTPQDEVDALMKQTAEEANIELQQDLASKDLHSVPDLTQKEKIGEEDDMLAARLRALGGTRGHVVQLRAVLEHLWAARGAGACVEWRECLRSQWSNLLLI